MGGGGPADPHVLKLGIEHPVCKLCVKIRNRFHHVIRYGKELVRFRGLCDGKRMVRKGVCFYILCGNVHFFRKNFGARYLIG